MLNVSILSSFDIEGGASIAAYRLHKGMRALDQRSVMIVKRKIVGDTDVVPVAIKNLKKRFDAGANVLTSLIPPSSGLSGVSQIELDINEGHRMVEGVLDVIEEAGLEIASASDYLRWIDGEMKKADNKSNICETVI